MSTSLLPYSFINEDHRKEVIMTYVEKNKLRLTDELYELVKDEKHFKAMGMDEQGEFILHLLSELDKDVVQAISMLNEE